MDKEPKPNAHIAGDRLLKILGIDPNKWTVGDRRIALLGIGIGLTIVIIAICGYVFGWEWTGLTKPEQRTFWDWLSLLIVPIVLALGGYMFNRSDSRRNKEDAERQRLADLHIADQRAQDEALQAYLDQIGQLLLDKDKPLRRAQVGDEERSLARARTLSVLSRLDGDRKGTVVRFLYESGLIGRIKTQNKIMEKDSSIVGLRDADLRGAVLAGAVLSGAELRGVDLNHADLHGAALSSADLRGTSLREANLSGAYLLGINLSELDSAASDTYWPVDRTRNVDLRGADLKNAILVAADLSSADLSSADLSSADLSEAFMDNTDLRDARLIGANLESAMVTDEQLEHTGSLEGATMPNGQKYEDWLRRKGSAEDGENSGTP